MSIMISTPLVIGPASIGTSELVDGAVTAAKIDSGAAADGQVLTADGAGSAAWEAAAGGGPGYKTYVAMLTQVDTDAPQVVVLANTIGPIVWVRSGVGIYSATLANAFPENKVWTNFGKRVSVPWDGGGECMLSRINGSQVRLEVSNDNVIGASEPLHIEIRVYP